MPAVPDVLPQLVANDGLLALQAAIADPERFAVEPKVDGVRGLVVFDAMGSSKYATAAGSVATDSRPRSGQGAVGLLHCQA